MSEYENVRVITGAVVEFSPERSSGGKRACKFRVQGAGDVWLLDADDRREEEDVLAQAYLSTGDATPKTVTIRVGGKANPKGRNWIHMLGLEKHEDGA